MSRLISVILLSILMFPLAAVVYFIAFIVFERAVFRDDEEALVAAGATTCAFVGVYWLALWRKSVVWTPVRKTLTGVSAVGAGLIGLAMAAMIAGTMGVADGTFVFFFASLVAPLFWVVATIFIWRETAGERAARLDRSVAAGGIVCPTCGYNLTGLKGSRCPECGVEFTIDQLLASQPGREQVEIEG